MDAPRAMAAAAIATGGHPVRMSKPEYFLLHRDAAREAHEKRDEVFSEGNVLLKELKTMFDWMAQEPNIELRKDRITRTSKEDSSKMITRIPLRHFKRRLPEIHRKFPILASSFARMDSCGQPRLGVPCFAGGPSCSPRRSTPAIVVVAPPQGTAVTVAAAALCGALAAAATQRRGAVAGTAAAAAAPCRPRAPESPAGLAAAGQRGGGVLPQRPGRGFGATALARPRRRRRPSLERLEPERLRERLQAEHGDAWEAVERVVRGEAAACPEDMVRARFSALRFRDPAFLARTECGGGFYRKEAARMQMWEETLGLKERSEAMTTPWDNIQDVENLEVIEADGLTVLYKIHCGIAGYLYEQGVYKEHPELGYVYSINDIQVSQWEDSTTRKRTDAGLKAEPLALTGA